MKCEIETCDQTFEQPPVGPTKRFCSGRCRAKARRLRDPVGYASMQRARNAAAYIPHSWVGFIHCSECGDLATVRTPQTTRCKKIECKRSHQAARMRAYWQTETGREIKKQAKAGDRRRRKAAGLSAVPYNESSKARYQRRRAAKRGTGAEVFLNSEIFDRDDWVCGICEEPVDRDLVYPDPMSVSLDHVTPLSLGGEHSRANTRCSHLICNVQRGNRVA